MKRLISLMLCAVAAMLSSCGNMVGGGDDFPNSKVYGAVIHSDMTPASSAIVCLIPEGYNPVSDQPLVSSHIDTTDNAGSYSFIVSRAGHFNIQVKHLDSGTKAFIGDIRVTGGVDVNVPTAALRRPGAVSVTLPAAVDTINGYLYVPGTLISGFISIPSGRIVLDSLPAGTLPGIYYAVRNNAGSTMVRYRIDVVQGDTVDDPGWAFSRQVSLNTTASGAQIVGNVVGFPVLIRLTGADFDFAAAKSGGVDLYFAKPDNTQFPYEIELWDSAGSDAAVWVLVDTVYGNNNSQYFTMYWGNASAGSGSNPAAVFDTANGFQGVWHLADAGNSTAKDATANQYDGTPSGMTTASATGGMIGGAQEFDGTSSYFTMTGTSGSSLNFPEHGTFTISAWVYADTLTGGYQTVVSKGNRQYSLQTMWYSNDWEFSQCKASGGYDVTSWASASKAWTHLVGIRNDTYQYLFVDGVCTDSTISVVAADSIRYTGDNLTIGKNPSASTYFFNGKIDEVRASNVARSPDWIKLSYMNQKASDALVVLK